MTLTLELPPDVESRLHELSARTGQKPEDYLIGLVRDAPLTEGAEADDDFDAAWEDYHARFGHEPGPTPEEVLAGLLQSDREIAVDRWLTLEEVDAALRTYRDRRSAKSEFDAAVVGIRRGMADAAAGREISLEDYRTDLEAKRLSSANATG